MSGLQRLVLRIYQAMLAAYPGAYRRDFGDEMLGIFKATLGEITAEDWLGLLAILWREIRNWPAAVLQEHLRERRHSMAHQDGLNGTQPLKRSELLAALAIFLIPPLSIALGAILGRTQWLGYILVVFFLGCGIAAFGLVIGRGLPRWSLPYMGVLLTAAVFFGLFFQLWGLIYPHIFQILGPMGAWSLTTRILYQGLSAAFLWFLVLLTAIILVTILRLWSHTRGIWQRTREDWTQLSFLVYGGIVLYIPMIFDEYRYDEPWQFAAWVCLGLGCWLYLRSRTQRKRFLVLLGGATLAMWIVALGKWYLVPQQDWPSWFSTHTPDPERWFEAGSALAAWVCIVMVLLAPALLSLLPRSGEPASIPEESLNPA